MNLAIIGNGFDCTYNLNTKYFDFKKFVFEHDYQEYLFLKILFGENFDKIDFWNQFEKNLDIRNFFNFVDKDILNEKKNYSNILDYLSNGTKNLKDYFVNGLKK